MSYDIKDPKTVRIELRSLLVQYLSDAKDGVEILDSNPEALRLVVNRIKSAHDLITNRLEQLK